VDGETDLTAGALGQVIWLPGIATGQQPGRQPRPAG
jgi:hypothetical protein